MWLIALNLALSFSVRPSEDQLPPSNPRDWPTFRGWYARGVADGPETPVQWDVESGENVLWSKDIPGLAHSSPAIWNDRIFITTAERQEGDSTLKVGLYGAGESVEDEGAHSFTLFCIEKESGDILWEEICHTGVPKVKRHPKSTHANSSPATDGEHVLAFFGSEGLYCYDMDGIQLWKKDFGVLTSAPESAPDLHWGFASSPIIFKDLVIVQCDAIEGSFLAALELKTGKEVWRTKRVDTPTWGSPTVHVTETRAQVIVNGYHHIGGYDLKSGDELWKLEGGGDVPVPTPVVAHDLIYITNAHGRLAPIYAIKLGATGTLTPFTADDPYVAWSDPRRGVYMQTPLVYGDHLYLCSDAGVLGCYDAKTGKEFYRERLGGGSSGFSASGVACNGKLYYTGEEGQIFVVQAGPTFKVLASNSMGEQCMATPAISDGCLYTRAREHLFAIGAKKVGANKK